MEMENDEESIATTLKVRVALEGDKTEKVRYYPMGLLVVTIAWRLQFEGC